MTTRMLIDARHREETRVAVVKGNRIEEFDFESAERKQLKGNIYLAKVTRVEPSLQAAFVDYGGNRHGFLAFSEIHPDYYQIPVADRQALIEADARAARDEDEAEDHPRGGNRGNRGRNRHRERPHSRRDQSVSSAPVAAAELGPETIPTTGENVAGEPPSSDSYSSEQPSGESVEQSASEIAHQNEVHAEDARVAEDDHPPVSTEQPHDDHSHDDHGHDHEAHGAEHGSEHGSEHESSEAASAEHTD